MGENTAGPALPYAVRSDRKTAGATSTGAVNGTFVDMPFETNDLNEGVAGLINKISNTEWQIVRPGIYRAAYAMRPDAAGNVVGWEARAVLDGVAIPQSGIISMSENTAAENIDSGKTFIFKTTAANQIVKFQAAPTEGAAVDIVIGSTAWIELVRLT